MKLIQILTKYDLNNCLIKKLSVKLIYFFITVNISIQIIHHLVFLNTTYIPQDKQKQELYRK